MTAERTENNTRSQYGRNRETDQDFRPARHYTMSRGQATDLERPYGEETYYGVPPIKPSHYGWLIVTYFFVGGLASAAQFIATVADLVGGGGQRKVVRAGRYLALLGSLASPLLLIADLHTPQRWFNMMRIYRRTSAMSIGSWALSLFGAFSGLTAVAQLLDDLGLKLFGRLARLFQLPAALAGGVVSLYTGTLLAATNPPLVAAAYPYLSSLFASSAASTATAALSLAATAGRESAQTRRWLNLVALITGISELIFALVIDRSWRRHRVAAPVAAQPLGAAYRAGVLGLGISGPLVVHGIQAVRGREQPLLSVLASVAMLIGGFILRAVFVFGGNQSGRRSEDYFRFTEPAGRSAGAAAARRQQP